MLIRTDQRKEMYGLYQSLGGGVKPKDSNSLETILRKLKEETELQVYHSKAKWIGADEKFDCNIYAIELDIGKNSQ